MQTLVSMFGASLVLCCLLTPLARWMAIRWGLVDHPDARRKLHDRSIPVAGGLAIMASGCVVLAAAFVFPHPLQESLVAESFPLLGLLLAAAFVCALGVLDDFGCLRGRYKLMGQVVAVGIVMGFGVRIHHLQLFGWDIDLGAWALPFTLLWLLGAINALNLLDGMDGMLGSVGLVITLAMAGMAVLAGHWAMACVAVVLAGTLFGFLLFNFPPATIFMGDAGSMLTGLVVGVLGIQSSLKAPSTVALIAPLAILTIPFFDTAAAVVRRRLTGRSIYTTDRGHLHHCLLQRGFSTRAVLVWASLFCVLTSAGALASLALKNDLLAVCTALMVIALLIATRLFGYAEFLLVKKRSIQIALSFFQNRGVGKSHQSEVHLHGKVSWKALIDAVTARGFDLNLQTVRLEVSAPAQHEEYYARWDRFEAEVDDALWRAEIPLVIGGRNVGRLLVSGYSDAEPLSAKVAALTQLIEKFEHAAASASGADATRHGSRPVWGRVGRKEGEPVPAAVGQPDKRRFVEASPPHNASAKRR